MTWQQGMQRLLAQLEQEFHRRLPFDTAEQLSNFAHQSFDSFCVEDVAGRELEDIYGSILGSWTFIQEHDPATPKVRVINPDFKQHGWQIGHTVVAILCRNTPFITDSIRGELHRRNITIHIIHSSILSVLRDQAHGLVELLPDRSIISPPQEMQLCEEALLYLEIGRCTDEQEIDSITQALKEIIGEVTTVVDDFRPMRSKGEIALTDAACAPRFSQADIREVQAFIEWLCTDNFMFLGYEKLSVAYSNGSFDVYKEADSRLGLLREYDSLSDVDLHREIAAARDKNELINNQIIFSKVSKRSRVHRLVYPDYVNIKCFNSEGQVIGEHRFMGLYTSRVYNLSPTLMPVIRVKVATVLNRSGLDLTAHEGKDLATVLELFPRDELFQSSVDELFATTMAVNQIQERRQVRLFVREDLFGKFVSCLVYVPRDIHSTTLRKKIETLLAEVFSAQSYESTTFFSESGLARTRIVLHVDDTQKQQVDIKALEKEVVQVTMSWQDHLQNYLVEEFGEEQGSRLLETYADAFPPGYCDDFSPRAAIVDIKNIATLSASDDIAMSFYRVLVEHDKEVRFRLIHRDTPLPLSDVMPVLEHLGLRVLGERPYEIKCFDKSKNEKNRFWIHEFSLTHDFSSEIDLEKVADVFQEAFGKIWEGHAESDSFNRLIFASQLGWRKIAMLRAYSRYMKQIQFNFSSEYIADTLTNHVSITRMLVDLFNNRFDPDLLCDSSERQENDATLVQAIVDALDSVENLGEDIIIRQYLAVIQATVRTNYFQYDEASTEEKAKRKSYFSFKLAPASIPDIPLPCPMFEIFVYSPQVEGVHLRSGKVARGGLRWSDRLEDYRTEILGLVKAQQVKNAVIVPAGAKGGFVAKCLPSNVAPEVIQAQGISCYKTFIQGLLDITDNLVSGQVVPPPRVNRHDDDDTYLVVAADKGTATFSDIANEISLHYGFWQGDAFASGGSAGYDHKKMGITARGAWVGVQRHFREMGINTQETDFTVVGIGDMGGDVFGNGMLLSEHIQLVCAFNHRHMFIDPNPDSAASFIERSRLFNLPKSSWKDYDAKLISDGGGVFKRSAKSVAISKAMKKRFCIKVNKLTPMELISAVLKAPVDLLWNGGIGTYIKASTESHADVGDKANDILRVNACELHCKVIGEGGNLGLTQLSRTEYALNGGRVNTDFIDNAAGVDCSDHEVNIKILLNGVIADGDLTFKQRNGLLVDMTDSVAQLVLKNCYHQTQTISLAERESLRRMGEYQRLIHAMESDGALNRQLEFIPDDDALLERKAAGKGLTRPELSLLTSYLKTQLQDALLASDVPDDPHMLKVVETAFPPLLAVDFKPQIHAHRLHREIISTQLANDLVNTMGITFVYRLGLSTGVDISDVVRAYVTARDVFDMRDHWQQIEALDYRVSTEIQMSLMSELMRLVRRASRWFVRNRREKIEPAVELVRFREAVCLLQKQIPDLLCGHSKEHWQQQKQHYLDAGVPENLASFSDYYPFLGIIEAAQEISAPIEKVAEMFFRLAEKLELDWFSTQISNLKVENSWQAMARESYRDDLEWQIRMLTVGAMRHICEKGDIDACIERWMLQQSQLVERWQAMLTQLHTSDSHEIAMYSVAIRELLDLAQSSRFGEVA
ncbi:MAG: NAD-glutamate dehydrogenase [Spongiibacteraceae bacterium]|nr:NAD-glutamate dehydrogenase [Spongiibacteraceae bacterium]